MQTWLVEFRPGYARAHRWTVVEGMSWQDACERNRLDLHMNEITHVRLQVRKSAPAQGSKLTTWMHSRIRSLNPSPMSVRYEENILTLERASLRDEVALKHSSIIHARINARTPGSMLAARHAGYVG